MSAELRDFRGKLTVEADAVLDTMSRVTGRDRSEIARDVLHKWAVEQIHVTTVLHSRLRAEGLSPADEGETGTAGRSGLKERGES